MSSQVPPELPKKPGVAKARQSSASPNPVAVKPGSISKGIGLAWAIMVVGMPMSLALGGDFGFLFLYVPPLVIVVAGVTLLFQTGSRTGTGLLLGLATVFATALLLVAACYGLMFAIK